ncbi:telomere repeat-binding protein 5-like [Gossypium arboreum]|uniref:telomere repeat-binding protein 5-like n=1 Tax=Gossypium arboreum TaxID=29729 RepID=UPI000819391F|nr:telomere repeat-binding protein 5-like [Gossypium arboreum]XP_017606987.1 telomere repeat-binding protein 5-like [Gossypium arboreum]XP_017606988.1 telomere repeat-binding protein 5-like [Gossypium arboreum]XP_052884035.1 telomere repeat-binding protein 5-like [Gossypium arboreum]XP_052884036.1 telomere repeat-binding protein 5-like [Gossypium arboreum]XP_052884037.1 telomere repeat-binding protein 5-like [Gossypium arboreum]
MVLQKRLDYGFNGYQVPAIPRATRSARKRVPFRKRVEGNQTSAFDLLATVAGTLLLDKESSPASNNSWNAEDQSAVEKNNVKEERQDGDQSLKLETCNVSELVPQTNDPNYSSRESRSLQNGNQFGVTSALTTSECFERLDSQKLINGKIKNEMGSLACKVETGPFVSRTPGDCVEPVSENKVLTDEELDRTNKASTGEVADKCPLEDPLVLDGKPPAVVSSDSSIKAPSFGEHDPFISFPVQQYDVNVVSRDDDEKSSGCTHPSPIREPFRSTPRIGDRRIRKILASRYWKVALRSKNATYSNYDENLKSGYCNRSTYKRLRSGRNFPFKKRKFLHYTSESNSDGGTISEGISDLPEKNINGKASILYSKMHGVTGESSSLADQRKSFNSRDPHVKLRIKSFRVPELFIEIPESATVGSLKRTVKEAVTAILGGGLCVGVLLQGKKVRDDNKTLLQTGISRDNQMDALGFSLEPNPSHASPSLCPGGSPLTLPHDIPLPLARYLANPGLVNQVTCHPSTEPCIPNAGNFIESNNDCTADMFDKSTTESKALVAVPAMSVETLAVPVHKKSKQSEVAQRRIRRPFSIAEVEALVQAVEKLGTGRWRDVKLRAFDNAKHRTYVDLKDKWKTLLHTARISLQQRRGEPVPQELLDRVLNAHTYWSQQQAKQQQLPESCLPHYNSTMIGSGRCDDDENILG